MEAKDRFKEDFEKWFAENTNRVLDLTITEDFYLYPDSMKWGVYLEFFDAAGIPIEVKFSDVFTYRIWDAEKLLQYSKEFKSRAEAQKAALEKAKEIYNSQEKELTLNT